MKRARFRRIFSLLGALLMLGLGAKAQKTSINEVLEVQVRDFGPIFQRNEVVGYFLFTKEDKIDRKTNSYRLKILDVNLQEVGSDLISATHQISFQEGCFNGSGIMLKLVDIYKRINYFRFYDLDGKFQKEVTTPMSKWDRDYIYNAFNGGEYMEATTFPVPGKGFINIEVTDASKRGYQVRYFDQSKNYTGWVSGSPESPTTLDYADFISCDEKTLLLQMLRKPSLLSSKISAHLVAIDVATGKKKFDVPMQDSQHNMLMLNGVTEANTGNHILFGQYSELGDNALKDNSLGLCAMKFDDKGKVVKTSKVSWESDISKFVPVNYKGKIKDIGYVYFHKIVQMNDGRLFAVGEQYKKAVSGGGVVMQSLGANTSAFKVAVQDLMIFEFSKDFALSGVSVFEKGQNDVMLPQGAGMFGPQKLAYYVNSYGGFDYNYTLVPEDHTSFTVCMEDWEKLKGQKGHLTFKSITFNGADYGTDKVILDSDAHTVAVYAAKPGHALILEYFRKEKRLDLHIEKLN